jgi:hypothetical protein
MSDRAGEFSYNSISSDGRTSHQGGYKVITVHQVVEVPKQAYDKRV